MGKSRRMLQRKKAQESVDAIRRLAAKTERARKRAFSRMSEEHQMLTIHTSRIYLINGKSRYEAAYDYLTENFGPKFRDRVLQDSKCLKILRLDTPEAREKFIEEHTTAVVFHPPMLVDSRAA